MISTDQQSRQLSIANYWSKLREGLLYGTIKKKGLTAGVSSINISDNNIIIIHNSAALWDDKYWVFQCRQGCRTEELQLLTCSMDRFEAISSIKTACLWAQLWKYPWFRKFKCCNYYLLIKQKYEKPNKSAKLREE